MNLVREEDICLITTSKTTSENASLRPFLGGERLNSVGGRCFAAVTI
jgi:hypothetical protein